MSMTFTSVGMHRGMRWNQLKHQYSEWRRRLRSRDEVLRLSVQTLRDIGISRCDVHGKVIKPFWKV
jgi:uncharacterized protein YjiS (DUF1127 family)